MQRGVGEAGGSHPPLLTPPANPNMTTEARNVLGYLQALEGNGMLAGQQETDQSVRGENDRLHSITGRYPAMNGHEVADYTIDPMSEAITAWHSHRRLQSFSWHVGAPPLDDYNWLHCQGTSDINRVLTPGTAENTSWIAKLDKMAGRLQALKDAQVPVLWRPLHEMNGNWFWWSKGGSGLYKQLWIQMYNYFTTTKQLDNLIWVWAAAEVSVPNAAWYPGDQYVDITGSDTYESRSNTSNWKAHYDGHKAIAPTKISALTECDYMPDPAAFDSQNIGFVWFLPWYGQWVNRNSNATMTSVYNHSYVITADEMPDLT